jgi:hypothetical protein
VTLDHVVLLHGIFGPSPTDACTCSIASMT